MLHMTHKHWTTYSTKIKRDVVNHLDVWIGQAEKLASKRQLSYNDLHEKFFDKGLCSKINSEQSLLNLDWYEYNIINDLLTEYMQEHHSSKSSTMCTTPADIIRAKLDAANFIETSDCLNNNDYKNDFIAALQQRTTVLNVMKYKIHDNIRK